MQALGIELERSIAEEILDGLPPPHAPGLEPIERYIQHFRHARIDVRELVVEIDRRGDDVERNLLARIVRAQEEERLDELRALRASWRWLKAFPVESALVALRRAGAAA